MCAARFALVLAAVAAALPAQRGAITGRVVDPDGMPVAELEVIAVGGAAGASDAEGRFTVQVEDRSGARVELRGRGRATAVVIASGRADVGTIVLPRGAPIVGRVRDARGLPVPGVAVRALDALADLPFFPNLEDPAVVFDAAGVSGTDGAFRIDGGLVSAARVVATLEPGIETAYEPIEVGQPVDLVLPRSRPVSVRVVEPDGTPVQLATVLVGRDGRQVVVGRTDADGALVGRAPFGPSHSVSAFVLHGATRTASGSLALPDDGPVDGLRLELRGPDGPDRTAPALGSLTLRASDELFTASVAFGGFPARVQGFLPPGPRPLRSRDGAVRIPFVRQGDAFVAELRAAGKGRTMVRGRIGRATEVEVELSPESLVHGQVFDATTGDPVGGVAIGVMRAERVARVVDAVLGGTVDARDVFAAAPPVEAVSRSDGAFDLRELGPGRWTIVARVSALHPPAETEIVLGVGDCIADLRILVDCGGAVRGTVAGASTDLAIHAVTDAGVVARAVLDADGAFALERVPRGPVRIELVVPQPVRLGAPQALPVGEVRIGDAPVELRFDARDVLRQVAGRLRVDGTAPPSDRLVAVLEPVTPVHGPVDRHTLWLEGAAAFVTPDGVFRLRSGLGEHVLLILDIATGVILHRVDGVAVSAGDVPLDLGWITARSARVRVQIGGAEDALRYARRIEVDLSASYPQGIGRMAFASPITRGWDRGSGVSLALGQRAAEFYVPTTEVELRLRGDRFGDPNANILARATVDSRDRAQAEVELRVEDDR